RRLRREAGAAAPGVLWLRAEADDRASVPGAVRLSRPLNPLARLATPWSDPEGWLASLSRSRRTDLRRQRRALSSLDCRVGPARGLVEGREVADLLWRNEAKYESGHLPSAPLALPYVEALIAHPDAIAIAYRDAAEHLAGIALLLDHPTWPLYWRWGAEPVRHLYFDSYARLLEWAVTHGKNGVILGKGKSDLKAALGAELVPSYAVAAGP
ncbi:hypothetical protein, partial [Actinomadura logoneensis]|uniref:hypothetical protein n=1 Tax=Actinomadura logoneensis TaxID=2293572 RepID=UPI0018F15E28